MRNPFRRTVTDASFRAAAIQRRADHEPSALELERDALRATLTDLVRAIETAPHHRWVTGDDTRRLSSGETVAVRSAHVDWQPLGVALVKAKDALGVRRG